MKITIEYKGYRRTYHTRSNSVHLCRYEPRSRRLTGYWYTDPAGEFMSWQDYEREYAEQESGVDTTPDEVKTMDRIVRQNEDYIFDMIKAGVKKISYGNGIFKCEY